MKNETTTSAPASASLLPTSEQTLVGTNTTLNATETTNTTTTDLSDAEKDDKFKKLEQEIQEEHANYRKLIQQQQKQYEER